MKENFLKLLSLLINILVFILIWEMYIDTAYSAGVISYETNLENKTLKTETDNEVDPYFVNLINFYKLSSIYREEYVEFKKGDKSYTVENLVPRKTEEISIVKAMSLDILIPGGGHFYTGDAYWGITFAALKAVGFYSLYYYYMDWKYKRSLYYSAKEANENIDPDHELKFENPDGGYRDVKGYRKDYDRSAQKITFAVLGTLAVYAISAGVLYFNIKEKNEKAIPAFDIQVALPESRDFKGVYILMDYKVRF